MQTECNKVTFVLKIYYRRKILLSILEAFGGQLTRTQMQKLAFILTRWQKKKAYDFVPYRFGCYSFQANQDLYTLTKKSVLKEQKKNGFNYWQKECEKTFSIELKKKDQELLYCLKHQFWDFSQEDLIHYTYVHYPFYAINSTISERYLNAEQLEKVASQKPHYQEKKLFTIGYEGISLEKYLSNTNNILDLRKRKDDFRPESHSPMDYDFSDMEILDKIKPDRYWNARKEYCLKKVYTNLTKLIEDSKDPLNISLATFKPSKIQKFIIEEDEREWKAES